MKKNLFRLVALVLALASLLSVFSVSLLAANSSVSAVDESEGEDPNEGFEFDASDSLFYNRTFDDGWDPFNGSVSDATLMGGHLVSIDHEVMSDLSYNYFLRFEQIASIQTAILDISLGVRQPKENLTILSFSIKADDACGVGKILTVVGADGKTKDVLNISGSNLYGYDSKLANLESGEWVDIDIIFDWNDNNYFTSYIYVNGAEERSAFKQEKWNNNIKTGGIKNVKLGLHAPLAENDGMGFCIDNLQLYQNVYDKIDLSPYGYGMNINEMVEKTIPIYTSAKDLTPEQAIANSLAMKLGINFALLKNERMSIEEYFAPTKIDGKIMIPLDVVIKYLGYTSFVHPDGASYSITGASGNTTYITLGRDNASVDGKVIDLAAKPVSVTNAHGKDVAMIAIDDIEKLFAGYEIVYDDMGLIVMHPTVVISGEVQTVLSREKNLEQMLAIMKKFVFDIIEYDEDGKALETEKAYTATGEYIYGLVAEKTNGFQHPYILVSGEQEFAALRERVKENTTLAKYAQGFVAKADAYYNDVVASRDTATGVITFNAGKAPVNVYMDGVWPDANNPEITPDSDDGYNAATNALYELEDFTQKIFELAFVYQLTEDEKYLDLAYAMAVTVAEWIHWAPGYFINCATAVTNFAISYDWLYNAWVEKFGIDAVNVLSDAIYSKALVQGYNSISGEFCLYPRTEGYGDKFATRTDSWNAIGAAGMVIGAMAIMDRVMLDDKITAEGEIINYVVGGSIINLTKNGLDQYAPDGSYIESVTYWAKGTNALMMLVGTLNTAAGNDLGITNSWGIYETFYYACHMESSDGYAWNYHEDGLGSIINADYLFVDTGIFNLAGMILGDENLFAIRENQINKGKEASLFDILFYPTEEFNKTPQLEIDYYMDGIDAFVSRSSWENGALYVGIMGGKNTYSPYVDGSDDEKFGQLDSGNFIYYNNGVRWIIDTGSDNFGAYQYFGDSRYKYYRNNAEGHNVVLLTSDSTNLPYGQDVNGNGNIQSHYISADGNSNYAIVNNVSAYKGLASAAIRGMMLTDNRETVIIQDEISLVGAGDLVWVVNTANRIEVDEDGRTAYLINVDDDGKRTMLRASIVAANEDIKFSVLQKNTYLLGNNTIKPTADQFDRSNIQRLAIEARDTMALNVAVVFEIVESKNEAPTSYKWTGTYAWKTLFEGGASSGDDRIKRDTADRNVIITQANAASEFYDAETAFTTEFYNFYVALTDVAFTLRTYPEESFDSLMDVSDPEAQQLYQQLKMAMTIYKDLVDTYEEYHEIINGSIDQSYQFSRILAGE